MYFYCALFFLFMKFLYIQKLYLLGISSTFNLNFLFVNFCLSSFAVLTHIFCLFSICNNSPLIINCSSTAKHIELDFSSFQEFYRLYFFKVQNVCLLCSSFFCSGSSHRGWCFLSLLTHWNSSSPARTRHGRQIRGQLKTAWYSRGLKHSSMSLLRLC